MGRGRESKIASTSAAARRVASGWDGSAWQARRRASGGRGIDGACVGDEQIAGRGSAGRTADLVRPAAQPGGDVGVVFRDSVGFGGGVSGDGAVGGVLSGLLKRRAAGPGAEIRIPVGLARGNVGEAEPVRCFDDPSVGILAQGEDGPEAPVGRFGDESGQQGCLALRRGDLPGRVRAQPADHPPGQRMRSARVEQFAALCVAQPVGIVCQAHRVRCCLVAGQALQIGGPSWTARAHREGRRRRSPGRRTRVLVSPACIDGTAGQPAVADGHVVERFEGTVDLPQQVAPGLAGGVLGGEVERMHQARQAGEQIARRRRRRPVRAGRRLRMKPPACSA